jgi:hypothetical protein
VTAPPQAKGLRVDVYSDNGTNVRDVGEAYVHCRKCLDEWTESFQGTCTPKQYARQQVATTRDGFQVWCTRHEVNVAVFTLRAVRAKKKEAAK